MGNLVFQATLGGQVNLVGPNTASTFNINVPAVAGNMVTTGDTGTVTNTMLASSAYTAPGTIGSGTANTGAFTTLSASSTVSGTGFSTYLASPPAIGGTAAAAGSFTALSYTTTLTGGTGIVNLGSGQFYKDASGNVGIGVTPSAWGGNYKTIQNAAGFFGNYQTGSLIVGQNYYDSGAGAFKYVNNGYATSHEQANGAYTWKTAASGTAGNAISFTQAMTLDASGNLLVGQTSSGQPGVVSIKGGNGYGVEVTGSGGSALNVNYTNTGTGYFGYFKYGGSLVGSISSTGTITVYSTTSDYRLKNVIGAVTGAGERIDALEPIEYQWKSDGSNTRGFLAHKFQEVYPQSVSGDKDAVDEEGNPRYQNMQAGTSEVIADLIAEIQSLRKRLTALENK